VIFEVDLLKVTGLRWFKWRYVVLFLFCGCLGCLWAIR